MNENEIFRLPIFNFTARLVFGLSIIFVMAMGSTSEAQKFDLESYLKKIDVNRNGRLDENEMSDKTKGWIEKMGFDTDKSVSISKILAKVDKDRRGGDRNSSSKSKTSARKVPGFGASERESTAVSRFDASGSSTAKSSPQVSDRVRERVDSMLERYDRNKNGVMESSEIKDARWGSPSPEESDKNKDGKLSRDELAARFGDRERYFRNSSSSGRLESSSREDRDRERRERDREKFRTSGRSSSSYSSNRPSSSAYSSKRPSSSSSSGSPSPADSRAKYQKYVESLIGDYDKDKDGKLNKEEFSRMRRPPAGADADKDGFITQSELLDSLSGANKTSTVTVEKSVSKSSDKSSKYDRKESPSSRSRAGRSRSGTSSSFENLDANADRHVQMHEFSSDWDEEKVAEFYTKDTNGDGVITVQEWAGRQ